MTAQRRDQILDAVVECILRFGLEGSTRTRIADAARVSPSAVHHFVGTQDEVMRAAVDRALRNVTALTVDAFAGLPTSRLLEAQLDVLFAEQLADPHVTQLIDELIAYSYRDEATRNSVHELYRRFQDLLDESIDAAYPDAAKQHRRAVSHALLALAHATATFQWLGFDTDHAAKARIAADLLIEGLASP